MSLTITIPGAVEATTGATAPATLTVGVGVAGATGPAGPGVPAGGTAGQFLTKIDGTNYNTDWTTVNLAQYLTTANAAATYQTLAGMSSYLTTSSAASTYLTQSNAASTYQTQAGMSSYLTTAAAASTYAPIAAGQPTSGTVGQFLVKQSGTNYDSAWATVALGDRYLTTSTTSLSISTGAKTLTVGTGLSYSSQQDIVIAYDASNHMHAVVTSYNSGTGVLVVDVQNKTGSGTYASWTVNVGGTVPLQSVAWGEIVGTLGNQSDLSTALNNKLETSTAASTYAPIASPTFTGTPAAPTAAVDTNTTQIATTAYVVGQGYAKLASPTFTGTVTIPAGASISGFAPLASPTFTGTPAAPTAAVDTNTTQLATTAYVVGQGYLKSATASTTYAPLASPALTGTPTAPTATAGTNTTQIATTAFVTAAIPAYATEAQALAGTSSTTVLNPLQVRNLLANAGYTSYSSLMGNYSSYQSGTAGLSIYSDYFSPYVSTANGKIALCPSSTANVNSFQSRGKAELLLDWTKPIWFSFRFHFPSGGTGDSNTVCRVSIGKTASTFGDLSTAGFGVKWVGGTSGAFTLMAHNGTTLTTSASAVTVSNTTYFPTTTSAADFLVYSDGAGNITLYCNGTSVATATGGPSSGTVTQGRFAFETDNTTSIVSLCAPSYMGVRSFFGY